MCIIVFRFSVVTLAVTRRADAKRDANASVSSLTYRLSLFVQLTKTILFLTKQPRTICVACRVSCKAPEEIWRKKKKA